MCAPDFFSHRFFALDAASKMKVCTTTNPHNRGWTPLGEETLDPARQTCGDTKEGYYIGRDDQSGVYGVRGPGVIFGVDGRRLRFLGSAAHRAPACEKASIDIDEALASPQRELPQ